MLSVQDIRRPILDEIAQFERLFTTSLQSDCPLLKEALAYVLQRRGKQLRPQLVILSAKICRGVSDKTLLSAVAMELLHTASLIHDDVVDASPLRRGNETLQMRWNNKVAVLVGDYILARAIGLIGSLRNTRILGVVSELASTLSSGELLQIHSNSTMWITEEQYYEVISQKTACLFAACMEVGAESSGASMRQTTALKLFGWHLGMCFQMKDDVLDYSDSEELGKPTMNDVRDGKATLPLLVAIKRAPKEEAIRMRQLAEDMAQGAQHIDLKEASQELQSFVLRFEGTRYTYKIMQQHKEKAIKQLDIFRDSSVKSSLMGLLDYTINRVY